MRSTRSPSAARRPGVTLALRRRPRLRSALVVSAGLLSGLGVAIAVHQADQARQAWGRSTVVLVATADLAAGDRLDHGNTRRADRPAPLVPADALAALPADRRLASPVLEGEVVRAARLAPAGLSSLAARLPEGTRAMAVPVTPGSAPPLAVGDHVDLVVALAPEAAGSGPPGFVLAADVAVVDLRDAAVTLAVPRDVAPRLAVAFGQGAVTLSLVGG
jgi:Flp pilus assembly protein CpaB